MNLNTILEAEMLSEAEVRVLRDNIYGPGTDKNWNDCKENWMQPASLAWLIANQPKKK